MKVKQLIKKLLKCDQNADVILSSDAEGNSYTLLSEVDGSNFPKYAELDSHIEFFDKDDLEAGEQDIKLKKCVVLIPR